VGKAIIFKGQQREEGEEKKGPSVTNQTIIGDTRHTNRMRTW